MILGSFAHCYRTEAGSGTGGEPEYPTDADRQECLTRGKDPENANHPAGDGEGQANSLIRQGLSIIV